MTQPDPSEQLAALVARDAIARLKYRYLRDLDQKDWDELRGCFTEDATAAYGGGAINLTGREEIMAFLQRAMGREDLLTSHRCHHPEIDLVPPDEATGVWALDDVVVVGEHDMIVHGAAFYTDRYRRDTDGTWRISHTGYRRTYEQILPRASVAGMTLTASWWGTGGRSTLPAP